MDRVAEFKELREALVGFGGEEKEATVVALCAVFGLTFGDPNPLGDKKEAATETAPDQMMTINTKLEVDALKDL